MTTVDHGAPAGPRPLRCRPSQRAVGAVAIGLAALLGTGCGIPAVPDLPEPGSAPAEAVDTVAPRPEGPAAVAQGDCFQTHVREAIHLNERRAPIYSAWSGGESESISRDLIRAERLALVAAWDVDRRARVFRRAGIAVGCAEFVSMSLTPPLESDQPEPPRRPYAPGPDPDSLTQRMIEAYRQGGFHSVAQTAAAAVERLDDDPNYNCMLRHLLESVWRVARLAPRHAALASSRGLPSPEGISERLLRFHLAALPDAAALDRDAAPLQEAGIPILCRDVPPIPME